MLHFMESQRVRHNLVTEQQQLTRSSIWPGYFHSFLTKYILINLDQWIMVELELECEVKWALEKITTNKASGCDGIPVELFQILKDDAAKVLHSIC